MNNFSIKDVIFYMEYCEGTGDWISVFPSQEEEWTTAMMWYLRNKEMGYGGV